MSVRNQKLKSLYSERNVKFIIKKIQERVYIESGEIVKITSDELKQFMITEVETNEYGTVEEWNTNIISKSYRNIMTNLRLRRVRTRYQSRGKLPRPFFRSINDSVRGTHTTESKNLIGRPSKNRTDKNLSFD